MGTRAGFNNFCCTLPRPPKLSGMTQTFRRLTTSWEWLLALFTFASLGETIFWGQMSAFTPLYLPHLGVPVGQVAAWTAIIIAVAGAAGIPFLPFWGTLRLRALFTALFVLFAGWIMALTFVPVAITALYTGNQPGSAVGLIVGGGGVLAFVLSPALGALADRYGIWRVLIGGSVVAVLLWPLPALAKDLSTLGITYAIVNGVTSGVF